MLNKLYNKHTGQSIETIEKILDRDTWYTAEEAKNWGIIDEIIEKKDATSDVKPEEGKKE